MDEKKVYIPLNERLPNEVDELETRIAEIQENCLHDFRLTEEPELRESNREGFYIVYNAETGYRTPTMKLRCLHCSKEKQCSLAGICPRCAGKIKKDMSLCDRTAYFKNSYLYFAVRLYRCENCRFAAVSDEWDQ